MRISIIVPAFNEERLLAGSLAAMRDAAGIFDDRGWASELIVCDNNSTDRTAEIARAAGASVVFEPVNQIARARNTGASAATGDWLLFIDADSYPCPALFTDVAERIESGRVIGGGTTIRIHHKQWMARCGIAMWNLGSRVAKIMAGSFIFVDAAAFRQIGGFSHEWFAGEELDFSRRLGKSAKGTKRSIVILHRHPLETSARKADLYTPWEAMWMLARIVISGGRSLKYRETTHLWYDGRR